MHRVKPKVFLIGETRVVEEGLQAFLEHIGAPEWTSDAPSDAEKIIEVNGRICYKSFQEGLNKNVTKVRGGNKPYMDNILSSRHGSVMEHAWVNFAIADISRVFTHELVRHRIGVGISQESLRFVRLDNLGLWLPTVIREDEKAMEIFSDTFERLEGLQIELAKHFDLDSLPFKEKKKITSAMRRIAPIGLATNIGWSVDFRELRHIIEMRTDESAEEEIRFVFSEIARMVINRYPNTFSDFEVVGKEDGIPIYKPKNSKV